MSNSTGLEPAQMTALGQQGRSMVPIQFYPDRGLILRSSLLRLAKDAARAMKNLRWNGIAWTTDKIGFKRHRATVFNGGAAFKELAYHYTGDGAPHFVQQVGKEVQSYDVLGNPNTTVESVLFTASQESIPCMRSFSSNQFLYVNGVDIPQIWDGAATWTAETGWPITVGSQTYNLPDLVETFNGRAVYAGFSTQPFDLVISEFNNPQGFNFVGTGLTDPNRAGIIHVPSKYGPVVTIRSFRISAATNQEILLIGCKRGFLFVGGTDATNFQTIQSSNRYGFVSNRAWMKLDDTAFALCTDGIRPFQGNINYSALESSALSYPIHPRITGMARGQAAQAFVIDNPDELEAVWYFPSGSDVHNRTGIRMNYQDISNGLVRFSDVSFPNETADPETYHAPSCGLEFEGKYYCGGYNGYLQEHWNGNKYHQAGIDYQFGSPLLDPPTPAQTASVRGFWIECEGASQGFTARAWHWPEKAAGNVSRTKSQFEKTFSSDADGDTIMGLWTIGVSAFGGAARQMFKFMPGGAGHGWELELYGNTANGDLSLVGFFATLIGGGTRG